MSGPDPLDPPEATQAAVAAAAAADVVVRELHRLDHLEAAQRLFEDVWRPGEGEPSPMTVGLLRALEHAGSYVVGAFAGARMVGASAGFFTAPPDPALHSHITGVAPGGQHRGIGFALKLHQRAWALVRGVPLVVWTYDPLVARNAWLNLGKLQAKSRKYGMAFQSFLETLDTAHAYNEVGEAAFRNGDHHIAKAYFENAANELFDFTLIGQVGGNRFNLDPVGLQHDCRRVGRLFGSVVVDCDRVSPACQRVRHRGPDPFLSTSRDECDFIS